MALHLISLALVAVSAASDRQLHRPRSRVVAGVQPPPSELAARAGSFTPNLSSIVSVLDFGAVGDTNVTDNTVAFQAALDAVSGSGGIVFVPAGGYMFLGSLILPEAVSLVGSYTSVPSHDMAQGGRAPNDGSVLLPRGGRGSEAGSPFLSIGVDGSLRGICIYYPDVSPNELPVPYPWTILMSGNNAAVQDVELLNSWNGINATLAHRHYIARVQGQPANIGIFVDQTYDIGRIEDVHWNPFFSTAPPYIAWQSVNGIGFEFARTDWEYMINCFVFGMSVGYKFIASPSGAGSCNGNFVGIGADACQNASVQVDASDPWGILINNGEFTSFTGGFGPDVGPHTQLVVSASNAGSVRISNSAFWGPSFKNADIAGSGSVGLSDCIFNTWDANNTDLPSVHVHAPATVLVRGCEWQSAHPGGQVLLDAGVSKAVIAGNLIAGPQLITDNGAKVPVIANNAAG